MRMHVSLMMAAVALGLSLMPAARAASPGSTADAPSAATPKEGAPGLHADSEWKALLAEMQAEGLIAIRKVGWKAPSSPASTERPGDSGTTRRPSPTLSPKGVREPPCPSP